MSAPRRRSGVLVTTIARGCESKVRYSDQFGARAAGQILQERNKTKLFIYPCKVCRGWHLTKKVQSASWQDVDYDFGAKKPREVA